MALDPSASPMSAIPSPPAGAMRESPPLPTNSAQFNYACRCLNVQVDGRISLDAQAKLSGKKDADPCEDVDAWLGEGCEHVLHPAYVSYTMPERDTLASSSKLALDALKSDEAEGLPYRMCWLCRTEVHRLGERTGGSKSTGKCWVTVRLGKGVKYGRDLENALAEPRKPFSGVLIDLPSAASTFGRPPQAPIAPIYPPKQAVSSPEQRLIPDVYDPFFLPPPFVPSHPHLQSLCEAAVAKLKARHAELENEVKQFIVLKARDMMQLEETVRSEVEFMWNQYAEGPGADPVQRGRSDSIAVGDRTESSSSGRTKSRERVTSFSPPQTKASKSPTVNPIMLSASTNPPYPAGASLLSASISANYSNASIPPHVPDAVEDSLEDIAHKVDKTDDQRAVAMSYVFSALDDRMASSARQLGQRRKASESRKEPLPETAVTFTDEEEKDSWVQIEKEAIRQSSAGVDGDGVRDATPKADAGLSGKSKDKHKVTFQEPERKVGPDSKANTAGGTSSRTDETEDAEEVFDFELEDDAKEREMREAVSQDPRFVARANQIRRDLMESNIMKTFAANAPSHRHAWPEMRRLNNMPPSNPTSARRLGGSENHSEDEEDDDESFADGDRPETSISALATSVPILINMPNRPNNRQPRSTADLPAMEHKTSLRERGSVLVPSLLAAMRERGIQSPGDSVSAGPSAPRQVSGSFAQRRNSRSVSGTRDRERVKQFKSDPGAVFEAMADDVADEEDDEGAGEAAGEDSGTLRDSRTFVPPHVLARKQSLNSKDVGWRSMVNE